MKKFNLKLAATVMVCGAFLLSADFLFFLFWTFYFGVYGSCIPLFVDEG